MGAKIFAPEYLKSSWPSSDGLFDLGIFLNFFDSSINAKHRSGARCKTKNVESVSNHFPYNINFPIYIYREKLSKVKQKNANAWCKQYDGGSNYCCVHLADGSVVPSVSSVSHSFSPSNTYGLGLLIVIH